MDSFIDTANKFKFLAKKDTSVILLDIFGQRYADYRKKWEDTSNGKDILEYPLDLDFMLNDVCNIKCKFCYHNLPPSERLFKQYGNKSIPLEVYREIIVDGVKNGLCALKTNPMAEALMHPDILDYLKIAKDAGVIDIILLTNGHLLTPEISKELIKIGITWINVSIGATTKETYESMRINSNFELLLNNLLEFIRLKEELKSNLPLLRVSFVNTIQNNHELAEFVSYWEDKADVINVQNFFNWFHNTSGSKEFKEGFQIKNMTEKEKSKKYCTQPFNKLLLRNNGDITPCCNPQGLNLVFGNVLNGDRIYDVFNSKKMKDFRKQLNTSARCTVCEECLKATSCE
ncbi:radical SAM protein [Spirochaetia bacterium]|nr:radical SAM protein [Spirochaetia bacterium]